MKKILLFLLFLPFIGTAQVSDTLNIETGYFAVDTGYNYTGGIYPKSQITGTTFEIWSEKGKFVSVQYSTPWVCENLECDTTCAHNFVYADYKDVNPITNITLAVNYLTPQTTNEARICRICHRHEKRQTTKGVKYESYQSEYSKILEENK